jgi:hypothetical protein
MKTQQRRNVVTLFLSVFTFPILTVAQTPASSSPATTAATSGPASLPIMAPARRELPQFLRLPGQGASAAAAPAVLATGPASASPRLNVVNVMQTIGQAASSTPKDNGIQYHGGPIIDDANGINVYVIWYGDWSKNTAAQTIVTDFIKHLGGSPYTTVNTTYYDMEPGPTGTNVVKDWVTTGIHYMGSTTDNYSFGSAIGDNDVANIAENSVLDGRLPVDPKGVYFVITSIDVMETSGFCTGYCAFHGYVTDPGVIPDLPVGFIGNPEQCPSGCTEESVLPTPNNNVAGDGMVNMLAHETEESVSDPFGNAWYDLNFNENEDKCVWTFGKTYNLPNGSYANMKLGQRQYLIQRNWVNKDGGYCALRWDD